LGLFALSGLAVAGCGGKEQEADEAVVVVEPGKEVPTVSSSSPAGTPAATTTPTTPAAAPAATTPAPTPSAPAGKVEGYGTLKGQVTFNGNPPPRKELVTKGQAPKDPDVCAKDAPILSERLIVDGNSKGGGVKNVLVYIPKPSGKPSEEAVSAAKQTKIEFDQEHCVFEPHVLAMMAGAEVVLKNSDPKNHNINSRLKNNQFNSLLSGGQTVPKPIETAERTPGQLTCDIHPWMSAYWMVLDNPYFAVTDDKGNYEIKNVPAGPQKVVVWQEAVQGGFVTPGSGEEVNIRPNEPTTKNFAIDPGKVRPE